MHLMRKFRLTTTCHECGYKITKEIVTDLSNLSGAKHDFAKEVASIHKQHPDLSSFDVTDKLL